MSDLISRQAVLEIIDNETRNTSDYLQHNTQINIRFKVEELPTTVEERPRGEWSISEYEYFTCSNCGDSYYNGAESTAQAKSYLNSGHYYNYCPWCGADMRKKV